MDCPFCFYMDRRLGLRRPGKINYHLNNAVDFLLKKEFDAYRKSGRPHPLMIQEGLRATPYSHDKMEFWREPLRGGLQYLDHTRSFLLTGAPDDLWLNSEMKIHVVDYKATRALTKESLRSGMHKSYERQVEFYTYLLEKMGFPVSLEAFFVVASVKINSQAFDGKLEFDLHLIRHNVNLAWVDKVLTQIRNCLMSDESPLPSANCEYCNYRKAYKQINTSPRQGVLL